LKNIFFGANGKMNTKRPFLIANLGLFVIVTILLIYPAASSWRDAVRLTDQQRQIYSIYAMQAEFALDDFDVTVSIKILTYREIAAALDSIYRLVDLHGLKINGFSTADTTSRNMAYGRLVEVGGLVSLNGSVDGIAAFIYDIAEIASFISTVQMEFDENLGASLQVEFTLIGELES